MSDSFIRIGRVDITEAQAAVDFLRARISFISRHPDLKHRHHHLTQQKNIWITYWDPARNVFVFEPSLPMLMFMAELDRRIANELANESVLRTTKFAPSIDRWLRDAGFKQI